MEINSDYLKKENQEKMRETFLKERKVILFKFFKDDYYKKLKKEIQTLKFKPGKHYLTHCYSHAVLSPPFQGKFHFKGLIGFIENITNKKLSSWKPRIVQFSWKDYTLLHDQTTEKPGIDIIFDGTDDWNEKAGGAIRYVDGTGNYTRIPTRGNMLAIVQRTKHQQKFVEYVNHHGKGKRRTVVIATL